MIELSAIPNGFEAELVSNAAVVRGLNGAGQLQNRLGGHYRVAFTFPPLVDGDARAMKSRIIAGQRQEVGIKLPLTQSQGLPGTPTVDGDGQSGHSIDVTGLTPHYAGRVGWWLNITASDGTVCLHDVAEPFVADALGNATIAISPALRLPFEDGDAVELANPMVVGYIDGARFNVDTAHLYGFEVTIEEVA